jgi:hypothetical protein
VQDRGAGEAADVLSGLDGKTPEEAIDQAMSGYYGFLPEDGINNLRSCHIDVANLLLSQ